MPSRAETPGLQVVLREFSLHRDRWTALLCRRVGISRSDYNALEVLDVEGPLTSGELGDRLALSSGAVTALVDRLEKVGWAARGPHPDDRRKVVVALTEKSWKIGQAELEPYLQAIDATARRLSSNDRAVVADFLEALVDNVAQARRSDATTR